jgi:hypothetical protein
LFHPTALLPCNDSALFCHSQEEELRASNDPKFSHLNDDLHVEVTAFAPPAEAHARIAYALAEIRRFLVPVSTIFKFSSVIQQKLFLSPCRFNQKIMKQNSMEQWPKIIEN